MDQQSATWGQGLEHAALSDIGLRRGNNQDALAMAIASSQEVWQTRGHLFMVADGMGAHAAGELASKIAADVIPLAYHKLSDRPCAEALRTAILDANAQIHSRGEVNPDFKGMGTTCTVLVLLPEGALLAHVGDSRAYRLRGNRLEQLTFDHSLVWELRQAGQFSADVFPAFISRNIITRSLGPNPAIQVDLEGPVPIAVGDTFLLCTDGLSGQVKDEELGAVLGCLPPAEAAQALVELANLRGGPDNITVIVVRVTGPELARRGGPPPEPSSSPRTGRRVHPLVWTLLGLLILGALALAATAHPVLALVSLLAAAVTAVAAAARRYGGRDSPVRFDGRPLGRGPYASCTASPNRDFVGRLTEIVRQLRDAATEANWVVDWSRFNAFLDRAAAAAQSADHPQSAREYLHAISFMMAELKHQRGSAGERS
jgi:protein phosphatase